MQLQHYADRIARAIRHLSGQQSGATAAEVAAYMTAHGHRITARRAARYLDALQLITDHNWQRGTRYYR